MWSVSPVKLLTGAAVALDVDDRTKDSCVCRNFLLGAGSGGGAGVVDGPLGFRLLIILRNIAYNIN